MKKRFIFDENYIKRYAKKDKSKWLIIGLSALVLIIIIIIIILATRKEDKKTKPIAVPAYSFKENLEVEAGSSLPDVLDYFTKLENIDIKSIKIEYPEEFELNYDTSNCSQTEIEEIVSSDDYNNFSCVKATLNDLNTYGVKVSVYDDEYTVKLKVVDHTAPTIITKNYEIYEGDKYSINDFIDSCKDITSECKIAYYDDADYANIKELGEHVIKIIATDDYNNISQPTEAILTIIPVESKYTITFDSAGGTPIDSFKIDKGAVLIKPADPTRDGYQFTGWYVGNTAYDFNQPVEDDLTLTAHWEEVKPNNENQNPNSSNQNPNTNPKPNGNGSTNNYVDVSSVTLNMKKIYLKVGESKTAIATVRPNNATNKAVTWSSSDNSIATVDNNGVITGKKAGKATISAKAGSKIATLEVEVQAETVNASCPYGNSNYNNSYTLSVNLIQNNCAADPNRNYNEATELISKDNSSALKQLSSMGFTLSDNYISYDSSDTRKVYNSVGTGIVGYQIQITLKVIDPDNPYRVMTAQYIIQSNGQRNFIKNNITKNNVNFQ